MNAPSKQMRKKAFLTVMKGGKYEQAIALARDLRNDFPEDFECHLFLGVALMNAGKFRKSRIVLDRALTLFPDQWKLRSMLGHVHGHEEDWVHAEDAYRKSLDHAKDASAGEIAELHCSIGEALWAQNARESALEEWREALRIDPSCEEARESLKECTNEYGEPRAPSPVFDDLYHFQNIQTRRYLNLVGREIFESKEEAEAVTGIILKGWNDHVAEKSREMDRWTTKRKSEFFSSVTLDFVGEVRRWKG